MEVNKKLDSIAAQKAIVADKKEEYNKFLASDEEINKLNNQKINLEKQLATSAKLEKDKKELLSQIENERNDIEDFFSRAKDKLSDYGVSQDVLAEVDDFNHIEKVTSEFIEEVAGNITKLSEDIVSKKEDLVEYKQNIRSAQKPLAELDEVDNKCPVCQSDISFAQKTELIEGYKSTIEENEKLISQSEEEVVLFIKNRESFEEKQSKLQDLSKNIVEYKQKFSHLEEELVKLNEIDESLESKEYISDKLGELILVIAKQRDDKERCFGCFRKRNRITI